MGHSAAPDETEIEDLTAQFRKALMRLVDVVLERTDNMPTGGLAESVEWALALRQEELSARGTPLGHLRRLAHVTEGLLDALLESTPSVAGASVAGPAVPQAPASGAP